MRRILNIRAYICAVRGCPDYWDGIQVSCPKTAEKRKETILLTLQV